ncbi:hypothetical protein [Bradyrhizobium sp. SRS-191]|uniref:hypothetical protein n=1 Tax=Bradyrhizobium sp. SRS-191 TaxID=2962606 RepID=UPI00211DFA03|nr:hypothetical protein [Bradyrhizobium sp. SRS-191]
MALKVDRAALARSCKDKLAAGATTDDLVRHLRDGGCWKIDSIVVLRAALGITLQEAKAIVHVSPVWSDTREQDEALHDALFEAAESELGTIDDRRK